MLFLAAQESTPKTLCLRSTVLVQRRNDRSKGRQFRVKSKANWKARVRARLEMRRDGLRSLAVYALVWGLEIGRAHV